jgi:hypothetical protein
MVTGSVASTCSVRESGEVRMSARYENITSPNITSCSGSSSSERTDPSAGEEYAGTEQ